MALEKIFIADKLTLDSVNSKATRIEEDTQDIQTKVNDIQSNFPLNISGGTDWFTGTPFVESRYPSNWSPSSYTINITGKGIITSIYAIFNDQYCDVSVTADGINITYDLRPFFKSTTSEHRFPVIIPFDTSLKIQFDNRNKDLGFEVHYTLF